MVVRSDRPNTVEFPPQEAKVVRFVILATTGGESCIDELEVYGPDGKHNLALAKGGARAAASSCLAGYPIHQIEHLNDGRYGNDHSWIAASTGEEWAQIELPRPATVAKVVFSRDRRREYADRVPVTFAVLLSADGEHWTTVRKVEAKAAAVAVSPRRQRRGFAATVPPPPPPPRVTQKGVVVDGAPAELKAAATDDLGFANLALGPQAEAAASSCITGHAIHQIAHLNDGRLGNGHSWISGGEPSWAELDLGGVYWVYKVAFGSDSSLRYRDRAATAFSILAAAEPGKWQAVHRHDGPPVHERAEFRFKPVQARWVRVAIEASSQNAVRIDELEVYGQKAPIPLDKIGPLPGPKLAQSRTEVEARLKYAFLGEEHAWLKTYGRADLSPRLVPYNGRVKHYPRHVGDDHLPLPPLASEPKLDGQLDDPCWQAASRGVARVAHPYDWEQGPLVEHAVTAGRKGDDLYLAIEADRLLSSHVAVVSSADGGGCGVVTYTRAGLVFRTYEPTARRKTEIKGAEPLEGAWNGALTRFEVRLPLGVFPRCKEMGLRVGLGMGGKHTPNAGRPVTFAFSDLAVAQQGRYVGRRFRIKLTAAGEQPVEVTANAPGMTDVVTLASGQSKLVAIPAERGAIGPQLRLAIGEAGGDTYTLHLFRYDPLERALALMDGMIERFAARGRDVHVERSQLAQFRKRQDELLTATKRDLAAERQAFFEARVAKRRLFFREPQLAPVERILFVKRHAFEPSHNYSVLLDSRWRPGGAVCMLDIPRRDGRLVPADAKLTELFDAGEGIARTPMATFDCSAIYFAWRPSRDGYYHIYRMSPDGSGVTQLTDGIWHDYWPCPLPDGGLAMISSRCKARYLCWRPQVSVLFRMNADGSDIRPLSYANLSEWAPSVTADGRILWTRSEYIDKGADFSHTLWTIRPDGTQPRLVFGNTIIQPNGYANGREVPGTHEVCCTLISHFGDLNGPIALCDLSEGRFNPDAITSLTPEVPWPGMWPREEYFRDPVPVARDYVLVSHAPRYQAGLYVIDRHGNREALYQDKQIGSMCPTPFRPVPVPPNLSAMAEHQGEEGEARVVMLDVYRGIEPTIERGRVKYIRIVEEVRSPLQQLPSGNYRRDHPDFMKWYAAPVDRVRGPYGWPSYVAKASHGLVPVEADGSAHFTAPAGKTLFFQALDEDLNELQRMRSVVQFQPGENRSCIGCHENRSEAPRIRTPLALEHPPRQAEAPSWGTGPF
ncbi:MAG: discoidin domain-containing protein, partial [Planctomycetota bacterium]